MLQMSGDVFLGLNHSATVGSIGQGFLFLLDVSVFTFEGCSDPVTHRATVKWIILWMMLLLSIEFASDACLCGPSLSYQFNLNLYMFIVNTLFLNVN